MNNGSKSPRAIGAPNNAAALVQVWLDGPDGRIGRALLAGSHPVAQVQLARAQVVVATNIFDASQALALCERAEKSGFEGHLVFVSSLAERRHERWGAPLADDWKGEPWPDDQYGQGKRSARELLQSRFDRVTTLLLPRLLFGDGVRRRWRDLAAWIRTTGVLPVPGSGDQRCSAIGIEDTAGLLAAVCAARDGDISRLGHRTFAVGPPPDLQLPTVAMLLESFADGANLSYRSAKTHANEPVGLSTLFSAGAEVCDCAAVHRVVTGLRWTLALDVCRQIGADLDDRV